MSNIFILVKCKQFVPEKIMCKITPFAIKYNFLWVGGNSIKNYHTHHYRGPSKNIKYFKKEINKILSNSKLKYSIIVGNKDYLEKPLEKNFSILSINNITKKIKLKEEKLKEEKLKINKKILLIISKLEKKKYGYYLPVLINSIISDHPYKIKHDIFIEYSNKYFIIKCENKHALYITSLWLKRLSELINKLFL